MTDRKLNQGANRAMRALQAVLDPDYVAVLVVSTPHSPEVKVMTNKPLSAEVVTSLFLQLSINVSGDAEPAGGSDG